MKILQKFSLYLKQVRTEGKKINWPTRQRTIRYSLLVVVLSLVIAAFLGGFDFIFSTIVKFVVKISS